MLQRAVISLACCVALAGSSAFAYGPKGHKTVGAVADLRIAGKPIATKIADLLDGMTLAEAALLPDKIKVLDFAKSGKGFSLPGHKGIEDQLIAFVSANRVGQKGNPSHHQFHFTDVPVLGDLKYESGTVGRSEFDIVNMIPFCIKVLKGQIPEGNARKITKSGAVILLAHLVGDIHQPLHVGAQYFDGKGMPANPDAAGVKAFPDEGGNSIQLTLQRIGTHGQATSSKPLHTYWDDDTVDTAFDIINAEIAAGRPMSSSPINEGDVYLRLASIEPEGWRPPAKVGPEQWSVLWANEILPISREAHNRLDYAHMFIFEGKLAKGYALERADMMPAYHDFAGQVVRDELHKGGWRLAALLEAVIP
jgi:hypothetical protein